MNSVILGKLIILRADLAQISLYAYKYFHLQKFTNEYFDSNSFHRKKNISLYLYLARKQYDINKSIHCVFHIMVITFVFHTLSFLSLDLENALQHGNNWVQLQHFNI